MTNKSEKKVCKCGKGYMSQYDNKCGHCRTKNEQHNLEKSLLNPNAQTFEQIKSELDLRNSGQNWLIKRLPHNAAT